MILSTVLLRLTAAGLIFFYPLLGMLSSFFLDWFDSYLLIQKAGISRKQYHMIDKNIDQVWSIVMLIVGFMTPYSLVLAGLFLFRLLGHIFYLNTRDTRVFLFFPNVFEFAFFWFVACSQPYSHQALILLTLLKLVQEVSLHWIWPARLRSMKKHWHGYSPWLRALGWRRLGI